MSKELVSKSSFTPTDQLIPDLIALRGGLSLISKYTDQIQEQERLIQFQQEETSRASRYHQQCIKDRNDCKRSCDSMKTACQTARKNIDNHKPKKRQSEVHFWPQFSKDEDAVNFFPGIIITIVLAFVLLIIISSCIGWGNVDDVFNGFVAAPFFIALPFFPLCCLIAYVVKLSKERASWDADNEHELQQKRTQLDKKRKELSDCEHALEESEKKIATAYQAYQNQLAHEASVTSTCRKNISRIAAQAHAVNNALQETYGISLNESDWCNIDLIVHYIETGRADSLKEALIQVDRQRQTDQIVQAIQVAQESISQHIESAFARMGQALALSFERLDARLQSISGQLAASSQSTLASQRALMEKLDTQISVAQMNSVLLEKANKSSDELIHDLRYNQKYWIT